MTLSDAIRHAAGVDGNPVLVLYPYSASKRQIPHDLPVVVDALGADEDEKTKIMLWAMKYVQRATAHKRTAKAWVLWDTGLIWVAV